MVNDSCVALWSLPEFAPRELRQLGGGVAQPGAAVAWLAAGRGLDVAGFLPLPGVARHLLIDSRAGHAPLAAVEPDEQALLDLLQRWHGRLAADELLCEAGLARLYEAVCRLRGVPAERLEGRDVLVRALGAQCCECSRSVSIACAWMGDLAAEAALGLGARGGVYLGGDLVARLGDWLPRSPLRRRFEGGGRDRALLRAIPTWVVRSGAAPRIVGSARPLVESGLAR